MFVLTHHDRGPLMMEGNTTFTFVAEGIETALELGRDAAGERRPLIRGSRPGRPSAAPSLSA